MPKQLAPKFVERVWGKLNLAPLFPQHVTTKAIGEVWFDNGPVLIKFLFTSERLSVQVHPEDGYAAAHHNGSAGKTEMWHILAAEPGSEIALGFRQAYAKYEARAAAENGSILAMLNWIPAHAGETYFVPAGTVHALGGGYVVCEIQQTSDITYRLFDYNRGRELHLDHGFEVAQIETYRAGQPRGGQLAACPYFVTEKLQFDRETVLPPVPGAASEALIILNGAGTLDGETLAAGEVWQTGGEAVIVRPTEPLTALRTYTPGS
jgi:mannose-6-phosphate isomerase